MTGVFQQDQIDLRNTAEYVGECNSAQILASACNQGHIICKDAHQHFGTETGKDGKQAGEQQVGAKCDRNHFFDRSGILFPPVLRCHNTGARRDA